MLTPKSNALQFFGHYSIQDGVRDNRMGTACASVDVDSAQVMPMGPSSVAQSSSLATGGIDTCAREAVVTCDLGSNGGGGACLGTKTRILERAQKVTKMMTVMLTWIVAHTRTKTANQTVIKTSATNSAVTAAVPESLPHQCRSCVNITASYIDLSLAAPKSQPSMFLYYTSIQM